jgi:hypothetical protein
MFVIFNWQKVLTWSVFVSMCGICLVEPQVGVYTSVVTINPDQTWELLSSGL